VDTAEKEISRKTATWIEEIQSAMAVRGLREQSMDRKEW
jgi:hypothetical protein